MADDSVVDLSGFRQKKEEVWHCVCGGNLFYLLDNGFHRCFQCSYIFEYIEDEDDE